MMWRKIDDESDFIPGDWGYIYNDAHQWHVSQDDSGKPWAHGLEGENIIFTGVLGFWGHFGPGNEYYSFDKWMKGVGGWKSKTGEASKPRLDLSVQCVGVGIERIEEGK